MTLILKQAEDLGLTAQEASEAALDYMEGRLKFTLQSKYWSKHVIDTVDYIEIELKLALVKIGLKNCQNGDMSLIMLTTSELVVKED